MKMKKMLSFLTAAAMGASCIAGMAISASAADPDATATSISKTVSEDGLEYTWLVTEKANFATGTYNDLTVTANGDTKLSVNGSKSVTFEIGDSASLSSYGIKLGGGSTVYSKDTMVLTDPTTRVFSITPETDKGNYKISVAVNTGTNNTTRKIYVQQNGNVIATGESTSALGYATTVDWQTDLDDPIYIWSDTNVQFYGARIVYEGEKSTGGEDSGEEAADPSIALNKSELALTVGDTEQLTATVKNATADVDWKSSNDDVATVDSEGNVTAVAAGDAEITATIDVDDESYTATCKVTVTEAEEEATLQAVTEAKEWDIKGLVNTAGDVKFETATVLDADNSIKINAESDKAITIDGKNGRIKLSGTGSVAARNVEILPGVAGTLEIEFAHSSNSISDERSLVVSQNGETKGTAAVNADTTTNKITASVDANASVYIYSSKSGLNITSIKFTPATSEVEPTVVEPTITYGDYVDYTAQEGNDARAYTANVTAGTNAITGLTWNVTVEGVTDPFTSETIKTKISTGTTVTVGLVVEAKNNGLDMINSAVVVPSFETAE